VDLTPVLVPVVAIGLLVVVVLVVVFSIARRYKIASPSEAFIVTGRKGKAVTNPETGQVSTDLSASGWSWGAASSSSRSSSGSTCCR